MVSADWLAERVAHPDLIILDASLPKPKSSASDNPLSDLRIPGARFLDIDNDFSDTSSDLPHTMLSESEFASKAQALGINNSSTLIIYDNLGVYSSPRPWWMFRSMGHENVAVLDGGLPAWVNAGLATVKKSPQTIEKGDFAAKVKPDFFTDSHSVLSSMESTNVSILDARSQGRFSGTAPEPRAGLRGGHIPNSLNLPFEEVVREGKLLPKPELAQKFIDLNISDELLVFSCGSGLTACILALAANVSGYSKTSIYDGSWSEWGQPGDLPVAT